jgi:hypothetical protein
MVVDADGDIVWWAPAPSSASRAHLSWDAKSMWMIEVNVDNGGGEVRRVSMDGLDTENNVSGLTAAHHDFAPLPGGAVAAMVWNTSGRDAHNALIERAADGTITTLVPDLTALYTNGSYHPNAIHYHPADESYTISDRNPNLFVKVTRQGELVWQFGGSNPIGNAFTGFTPWQVNHGHHVLQNGNFLFFNNGQGSANSAAVEYALDTTTWTATEVWRHQVSGLGSGTLGDAERLPNGNTLVTYSGAGVINEVSPSHDIVMSLTTSGLGYADFRESLYGPPPR